MTNKEIKFVNSLKQKKFRLQENLFIAEGVKIVSELLHSPIKVKHVYATRSFINNAQPSESADYIEVSQSELKRISSLVTPNEVLAVCRIPSNKLNIELLKDKLTLVLDDIRDPGNLGTIIRIADWFGIENIICSNETADAFNPKVVQATMGSIARVNLFYEELNSIINSQQSSIRLPVYGALLEGENIYAKKLSSSALIVIGNESKGISEKLLPYITDKIRIPSFSQSVSGEAESLNAAVATAVICSEFRKRNYK